MGNSLCADKETKRSKVVNSLYPCIEKTLTLSRSTSVINIPNSEHIHASDKYILSFISVRSFANKKGLIIMETDDK